MPQLQDAAAAAAEPAARPQRPVKGAYDDMNTPASAAKGQKIARSAVNRGGGIAAGESEATPEEQAEYDRAVGALSKVMYEDDNTSQAIADQLRPEEKVGSVAKTGILLINQLDQRLDLDEVIIANFTQEVTDRMIDMYENLHEDEFSDEEAQHAFGATWEGVMEMFGIDEESYEELTQGVSEEEIAGYEQEYKQFLG